MSHFDDNTPSSLTRAERDRWIELSNAVRRLTRNERAELCSLTCRMRMRRKS